MDLLAVAHRCRPGCRCAAAGPGYSRLLHLRRALSHPLADPRRIAPFVAMRATSFYETLRAPGPGAFALRIACRWILN